MAALSHVKTSSNSLNSPPPPFHSSPSSSTSSSSTTLSSMKLKTIVQTRIAGALSRSKSFLIQILKVLQLIQFFESHKKNKKKNKLFLGSFRLHYNWCSSHVLPISSPDLYGYYDSTWDDNVEESQLSGYLHWLEENKVPGHMNEIDRLADMFIANCHEKFRLEKQESYRRFQEMMARSV